MANRKDRIDTATDYAKVVQLAATGLGLITGAAEPHRGASATRGQRPSAVRRQGRRRSQVEGPRELNPHTPEPFTGVPTDERWTQLPPFDSWLEGPERR